MSARPIATFKTNTTEGSVHEVVLGCDKLWAMGQEEAIRRLSEKRSATSSKYELVCDFGARAARIAAAYASFYLEQGEDGKPELKGRFYWMGLAAFASKQVRCGLDYIPKNPYLFFVPLPGQVPMRIGKNYLGKGNFWLFQDIFVWHWFYSKYPEQFEECAPERDTSSFEGQIKKSVNDLPWGSDALGILNNLQITDEIIAGFKLIDLCARLPESDDRKNVQLEALLVIADHEQRKILQPLIYEDLSFRLTLNIQASFEWAAPFVPVRVAAFSHACDVEEPELRVQMEDGDLYSEKERMIFIGKVALQYHLLMQVRKVYMENEIEAISTWSNTR